jgi:fatty-acyl-CoA synthase/long-chain acyl-CoA synthetase
MGVKVDHLTKHADEIGDRTAVIDDKPGHPIREFDYVAFNARVNALANGFLSLGASEGSHIAWWGNNSVEALTTIHAIRKSGGVSIPIPYRSTSEEALYLLSIADVEILVIEARYVPVVEQVLGRLPNLKHVVSYGKIETGGVSKPVEEILGSSSTPVSEGNFIGTQNMIFTSGTTGKPKGAVRKVGGEANQYGPLLELLGWDEMESLVFLTTGPLYHSGPSGFALRSQLVGATVVTQYAFDPEDWLRLVSTHRVSATFSAPTPIRRVTSLPDEVKAKYDVSSLSSLIANAAPWTMKLKRAYLRDFREDSLWEVYGSTELSVCTVLAPEDQLRKPGSCGVPAPGVEIQLVDESGQVISEPGAAGELYARSNALFETYYKSHDKYLEDHRDGYQTVGDIAYIDEEGYYFICDRKKDMIISGGVNVYPAEVENVLDEHPLVHEVAVIGIPDEEWGESVCAMVVIRNECSVEDIKLFARSHLSGPKVPKQVFFVDELPKTGSGKVLKRELRELIQAKK